MIRFVCILMFVSISNHCFTQDWPKVYGDNLNSRARKVIETYDKGYLIGSTIDVGDYHRYIWLIKTDINGNIKWEKKIGEGSYRYYLNDFNQTYDGGCILTFRCSKYDVDEDPVVMKLDACADIEWCTTLHSEGFNRGVKIIQTPDSNYLTLSMYHSPDWAERVFLFKLNQEGEVLWSHLYAQLEPGIWNEEGFDLTVFPNDSSYLITGSCDYIPTGGASAFWIKIDLSGDETANIIWDDSTNYYNNAYETVHCSDHYYSIGSKGYGVWGWAPTIYKLNNDGSKIDQYMIYNNDTSAAADAMRIYQDTTFVMGARWKDGNPSYQEYCKLFLTDTSGNILERRTLYNQLQSPRNIEITFDNKILVMCGFYIGSSWDIYFYKLNQNLEDDTLYNIQLNYDSLCPGNIISDTLSVNCGIWVDIDEMFEAESSSNLKIYPNPANNHVNIEIPAYLLSEETINGFNVTSAHQIQGNLKLAIYDVYGKEINHIEIPGQSKSIKFDVSGYSTGLHIAILYQEGKVIRSGKFIVRH